MNMIIDKTSNNNNHYKNEHLPEEILINIFSLLEFSDLQNVAKTCKMWNITLNKDSRFLRCWKIFHERLNMMDDDQSFSIPYLNAFLLYNRIQNLHRSLSQEMLPITEYKRTANVGVIHGHKFYEMDSQPHENSSIFAEIKVLNLVTGKNEKSIILKKDSEDSISEDSCLNLYLVGNNLCVSHRYKKGYSDYKVWDIEQEQCLSFFKDIPILDNNCGNDTHIFHGSKCYDFMDGFNVYNFENKIFEPINKKIFNPALEKVSHNFSPIFNNNYLAFLVPEARPKCSELRVLNLDTQEIAFKIPNCDREILFHAAEGMIYICSNSEVIIYDTISKKEIRHDISISAHNEKIINMEDMIVFDRYLLITISNNTLDPNRGYIFLFDMKKGGFVGEPILVPFHIKKMSILGKLLFCQTNEGIKVLNFLPQVKQKKDFEEIQLNKYQALNNHIKEIKEVVSQLSEDERFIKNENTLVFNLAMMVDKISREPLSLIHFSEYEFYINKYSLSNAKHMRIAKSLAWMQIHLNNLYRAPFLHKHKIEITPLSYFRALDKTKKFLNNSHISSSNCKALGLDSLLDLEALSINREIISVLSELSQIEKLPETSSTYGKSSNIVNNLVLVSQKIYFACRDLDDVIEQGLDKFLKKFNIDEFVNLPMKKLLDEMNRLGLNKTYLNFKMKDPKILFDIKRICSELLELEILRQAGITDLYLGQIEGKRSWEEIEKENRVSSLHEYQALTKASLVQLLRLAYREKSAKRQKTQTEYSFISAFRQ
jgi:hypothetical protein